ncbi:hypothetical protein [Streptomyces achromogenes]|uniref:hypothetical protein n=1 Tax=Streptomyces achromogenes TaxID=67255 RepID=UPI00068F009A|nr:hypothetical protein [Streptomyces achromogenes]
MADEQDKWLDRGTAERLLRGEPLEAVDPSARDQAERLARALGALSAEAAPATGELPGEQAALAAFRKAREAAGAERTAAAHAPSAARAPASGADAGPIRGAARTRTGIRARRPRRIRPARPARLALAAALTAGTLGGVAVAAGSGALPTPFGDARPRPAVTAGTATGRPLASPSPRAAPDGGAESSAPAAEGTPGGRTGGSRDTKPGETHEARKSPERDTATTPGTGWLRDADACRALRDGEDLDTGRRRALEHLAGGAARVSRYCEVLLAADGRASGTGHEEDGSTGNNKRDKSSKEDKEVKKGKEGKGGKGRGKGSGAGPVRPEPGHGGGRPGGAVPAPSAAAPRPGGPDHSQPRPGRPDRARTGAAPSPAHSAPSGHTAHSAL